MQCRCHEASAARALAGLDAVAHDRGSNARQSPPPCRSRRCACSRAMAPLKLESRHIFAWGQRLKSPCMFAVRHVTSSYMRAATGSERGATDRERVVVFNRLGPRYSCTAAPVRSGPRCAAARRRLASRCRLTSPDTDKPSNSSVPRRDAHLATPRATASAAAGALQGA